MPFQLSAGVNVSEIDLTTVVPAVATTDAAIAGVFRWGPVEEAVLVTSEDDLVAKFGKPSSLNGETWFTASSFLAYGSSLYVSRAHDTDVNYNAFANSGTVTGNTVLVKNSTHYETVTFDADVEFVAKYPGELGNSLRISVCPTAAAFSSSVDLTTIDAANTDAETISFAVGSNSATVSISNTATGDANSSATALTSALADIQVGDQILAGNSTIGEVYLRVTSIGAVTKVEEASVETGEATATISFENRYTLSDAVSSSAIQRYWRHFDVVDGAPGQSTYQAAYGDASVNDEMHIVVEDEDGKISGVPGTILEVFQGVSRATDAKTEDGGNNYYKDVLNLSSAYVWYATDITNAASGVAASLTASTITLPYEKSFINGADSTAESSITFGPIARGYDLFKSAEDIDVSLVMAGKSFGGTHGEQVGNYIIDNITSTRRDCVAFISPARADVVEVADGTEETKVVEFRNALRSSSYAVLDSGYKYAYDKYNDTYRWVPLNGDIAGLCAFTDQVRDAWFSPAGFNRGNLKNVVKLAWNPVKAERDLLYKNGVNPIVNFPGQGVVMYGDKTLLAKPSAFDRINVRRLFIVLEKAIARAAQSTLFEFNDAFTRSQFVNLVTPFLADVQGRRGITDFAVICDETNNTGEVIDRNEFVGDIYIKPARSINFIQLNFVAVRTGVEFSEIIGRA